MTNTKQILKLASISYLKLALAVLNSIFTIVISLSLTGISAWLIGKTWQQPPAYTVVPAVIAVRALGMSKGISRYFDRIFSHEVGLYSLVNLRSNLYQKLTENGYAKIFTLKPGEIVTRFGKDVDEVGNLVIKSYVPALTALLVDFFAVGWLSFISIYAGIILGMGLIISGVLVPYLSAYGVRNTTDDLVATENNLHNVITNLVNQPIELMVYQEFDTEISLVKQLTKDSLILEDKNKRIESLSKAISFSITWATSLACLLLGLLIYPTAGLSPSEILIITLFPLAAFEANELLSGAAIQYLQSKKSINLLSELLDFSGSKVRGKNNLINHSLIAPLLEIKNLTVGYPETTLLKIPNFSLKPGDRLIVTGSSGIGKSTLLSTIAGHINPITGEVTINGVPTNRFQASQYSEIISLFPEEAHIFNTNILENIRIAAPQVTRVEAEHYLQLVGLANLVASLPEGVMSNLQMAGESISGGERRRILLARAVAAKRRIILLDEPTEHLDKGSALQMLNRIVNDKDLFSPEQIIIVVTHENISQLAGDFKHYPLGY